MTSHISTILSNFPKKRPPLPKAYQEIYAKEYQINREGLSLMTRFAQFVESWMHYKVAALKANKVLEIGAGRLNHLAYEKFKTYDIIEPFKPAYQDKEQLKRVNRIYADIQEVPKTNEYDKIVSVAVFEHVEELPLVTANAGLLLKKGGILQTAIPCEGGFLWYLSVLFSTGLGFRLRNKMSVWPLMRYEHINNASEIFEIIKYFYRDVRIKWFPLPFLHLSVYAYIEARDPKLDLIRHFLSDKKLNIKGSK